MSHSNLPAYDYKSKRVSSCKPLIIDEWNLLADIEGPGIIKHIWITFPLKDKFFSRKNILRIFWDDEKTPSVESPLGDFFGVPMGFVGNEYTINSYFISVVPKNGLNCYFTMPFHKRARIELYVNMNEMGHGFYFQVDYELCMNGLPKEWQDLRFHAKYRMESPTESHGHRYVALEAEGSGYFIGVTFGIRRYKNQPDAWYHGGGDLFYIDGESSPDIIHGIGAEDYFGHSWGTETSHGLYIGNPYYQALSIDDDRPFMNAVLYRFHVHDPIRFETSILFMLGAMGDSISSVAYWYQFEPHKEFFDMPKSASLLQESLVLRKVHTHSLANSHYWNVYGPVNDSPPHTYDDTHPLEIKEDYAYTSTYEVPHHNHVMNVTWKKLIAPRGFVDFNIKMRPLITGIRFQTDCYAIAISYVRVEESMDAFIRIGFDDRLKLLLNQEVKLNTNHPNGFEVKTIPIHLTKGINTLKVKLSNTHNTNFKAWIFNLQIVDKNGFIIKDLEINDNY